VSKAVLVLSASAIGGELLMEAEPLDHSVHKHVSPSLYPSFSRCTSPSRFHLFVNRICRSLFALHLGATPLPCALRPTS
jgi:hypothetical protein